GLRRRSRLRRSHLVRHLCGVEVAVVRDRKSVCGCVVDQVAAGGRDLDARKYGAVARDLADTAAPAEIDENEIAAVGESGQRSRGPCELQRTGGAEPGERDDGMRAGR